MSNRKPLPASLTLTFERGKQSLNNRTVQKPKSLAAHKHRLRIQVTTKELAKSISLNQGKPVFSIP